MKQRLVGNKYPLIEIDGIKVSTRFLKLVGGQWMRVCTSCSEPNKPSKEFFIVKAGNILDRVCRDCRRTGLLESDEERECQECGFTGKATSANFYTNRGILMRVCLDCHSKRIKKYVRKYQKNNPRTVWNSKKISSAKLRSKKRNQEFDENAVRELAESYVENSSCPCCGEIMNNDRLPSLERIDSGKGYLKGNIVILCYRCNFLKSNASLKELENLVKWLKNYQ